MSLGLGKTLISLGILEDEACKFKSHVGTLRICKRSPMVMKSLKRNRLYILQGKALDSNDSALSSVYEDRLDLWHNKVKCLSDQKLLGKDSVTPLSFCETCVLGKTHMVSFGKCKHRIKRPLDHIHTDL